MELMTISQASKQFNISTRTLRYYEEVGLIKSQRKDDYAYRIYDENTVKKIQQILVLRKLELSLKQIQSIFENDDAKYALKIFVKKMQDIDREVNYLNAVKSVISMLVDNIKHSVDFNIDTQITDDCNIAEILKSLTPIIKPVKEKKKMEDIKKVMGAKDIVKDVRIIYLPPCTVASAHYIGSEPENHAGDMLDEFVRGNNLIDAKPDLRVYGFNNPNPEKEGDEYGYEFWVTIPENMEVKEPLKKKTFEGGIYAAYCIKMGDFHLWKPFFERAMVSEKYEYDAREPLSMGGTMEEHLNAFSFYKDKTEDREFVQLDLLIPVKEK